MSLRLSRFCSVPALAVLSLSLLQVGNGRAADQRRGRPIEFSDPKSAEITTNLNQLSSKRGGFPDLETDLTKSFQESFSSRSSLDGVIVPPAHSGAGPAIQNKKVKELLELKKNWALSNPEDLTKGPTMEELLQLPEYGSDGKEKKTRSSVENYYRKQDREKRGEADRADREGEDLLSAHKRRDLRDDLESKDEAAVAAERKESERSVLRLFDTKPGGTPIPVASEAGRGSLSDFFGLGNSTPSTEQVDGHKPPMKRFGEPSPSTRTEVPNSLSGLLNDSRLAAPIGTLPNLPSSSRPSVFDSGSGFLSSPLAPASVLPDTSAGPLNSWNPPAALPRVEQPKMIAPSSVAGWPQRKF